jgi:hypothetical protein
MKIVLYIIIISFSQELANKAVLETQSISVLAISQLSNTNLDLST